MIFAETFHGRPLDLNYGIIWSRWENWPIYRVKLGPELVNPYFANFSCANSPWIFGDSEFRRDFCQTFSWTSVKTLAIEPVGFDG
ncbi:hypothetical protein H5410_042201 [Solanum commersonii]|uniref:Uncharacterized protein n=1 Tax=Solanum commersonii TaxID=4109 RepID=A0A9J5XVQ3_SOLCO|nr:hypothetical protein H5410_042201 [Solanum commersonii]